MAGWGAGVAERKGTHKGCPYTGHPSPPVTPIPAFTNRGGRDQREVRAQATGFGTTRLPSPRPAACGSLSRTLDSRFHGNDG